MSNLDETEKNLAFLTSIGTELDEANALIAFNDTPFNRRTYVRTCFAVLEGVVSWVKSSTLMIMDEDEAPTSHLSMLKEETYTVDSRGKVQTQQKFIPIDANLRFAITMYAKTLKTEQELDCSTQEWQHFKTALRVRNRIVHPKKIDDLEVTDEELGATMKSSLWILHRVMEITEVGLMKNTQTLNVLKAETMIMESEISHLKGELNRLSWVKFLRNFIQSCGNFFDKHK